MSIPNKFLTLYIIPGETESRVILTPIITPVIIGMEKFFMEAEHYAVVTSGLRDAVSQLRIIRQEIVHRKLDTVYPEVLTCKPQDEIDGKYVWQQAWSKLLSIGFIVNPPLEAKCLMDYFGPTGKGPNMKGVLIHQTPHARGIAFNIGGAGNGVDDEAKILQKAFTAKLLGLSNFLIERNNNALHCNCYKY